MFDKLWPEFAPADLDRAVKDFARRERRFGGVEIQATRPSEASGR